MKIILDTSAALHVALQSGHAAMLMPLIESATEVLSPKFMQVELGNALWKYMRWQAMPLDLALQHWENAAGLIDQLLEDATLMPQALGLAAKHEHSVYDMLYVAAALQHGARLLTLDRKLKALATLIDPRMPLEFLVRDDG
jgi:predicted nucleic acid-binding protein